MYRIEVQLRQSQTAVDKSLELQLELGDSYRLAEVMREH